MIFARIFLGINVQLSFGSHLMVLQTCIMPVRRFSATQRRALVRLRAELRLVTVISWNSVHSDECRLNVISVMENKQTLWKVCVGNSPLFGKSVTFLFYFPVC